MFINHEANKGISDTLNDFPQLLLLTKMVDIFLYQNIEGRNKFLLLKVKRSGIFL